VTVFFFACLLLSCVLGFVCLWIRMCVCGHDCIVFYGVRGYLSVLTHTNTHKRNTHKHTSTHKHTQAHTSTQLHNTQSHNTQSQTNTNKHKRPGKYTQTNTNTQKTTNTNHQHKTYTQTQSVPTAHSWGSPSWFEVQNDPRGQQSQSSPNLPSSQTSIRLN